MPANVDNTVTTDGAAETPRTSNPFDNTEKRSPLSGRFLNSSKEQEDEQKRLLEEKRNGLRRACLRKLINTFKKEADCNVDGVVSYSERQEVGIEARCG